MSLPYENATSGAGALEEIGKVLKRFGCTRFGTMTDSEAGELIVQFTARGRDVTVKASVRGYATAWLKENPVQLPHQCTQTQHQAKHSSPGGGQRLLDPTRLDQGPGHRC
jgi:hypothetical protein